MLQYFNSDMTGAVQAGSFIQLIDVIKKCLVDGLGRTAPNSVTKNTLVFNNGYTINEHATYQVGDKNGYKTVKAININDNTVGVDIDLSVLDQSSIFIMSLLENSQWSYKDTTSGVELTNSIITIELLSTSWNVKKGTIKTANQPVNISSQRKWSVFADNRSIIIKAPVSTIYPNQLIYVVDNDEMTVITREGSDLNIGGLVAGYTAIINGQLTTTNLNGLKGATHTVSITTSPPANNTALPVVTGAHLPLPHIRQLSAGVKQTDSDVFYYANDKKLCVFPLLLQSAAAVEL